MAQITVVLADPILLDSLQVSAAVLPPIARMSSAPFASAVAANVAIFRIVLKLALAISLTPLLLASGSRTNLLIRVPSRQDEKLMTVRATSLHYSGRTANLFLIESPHWETITCPSVVTVLG